jgi:hypothetical protein
MAYYQESTDYYGFIYERRALRIVMSAVGFAAVGPVVTRSLGPLISLSRKLLFFTPILAPTGRFTAPVIYGAMGAAGGYLEDVFAQISYEDTRAKGTPLCVPLWTVRSMLPALLVFVNPALGIKCIWGEQKGCDTAMAQASGSQLQVWPFFCVCLDKDEMLLARLVRGHAPRAFAHSPFIPPEAPSFRLLTGQPY